MAETQRTGTLNEDDWKDLLDNIDDHLCTPFIGAGACFGILPLARDIASQWATSHNYPFEDDKTD